jgi:cysteinyl-tRNA synthetase
MVALKIAKTKKKPKSSLNVALPKVKIQKNPQKSELVLFNTATKKKETFKPLHKGQVSLYCCGPTVYHYAHLGNMRTFIFEDVLVRTLRALDYKVTHVMNITDVGHLTDDGDEGEDKLEKGAKREGKTVWEVAQYYTNAFLDDAKALNLTKPTHMPRATEYIKEQITLIEKLQQNGYTYVSNGNVYFDTSKFADYTKFARLEVDTKNTKQKNRVELDQNKKNQTDFVLWFTKSKFENHAMQWPSPWGRGYPGWHIECSAMATTILGETIDIHCGGIDHIPVHHTNEIAQSECATGKKFANVWMHSEFLVDKDGKMSKSRGDFLTVGLLKEKGINPLAYRYLCLQTHYRKQMMFSWEALESAQQALEKLNGKVALLKSENGYPETNFIRDFEHALCDDLNTSAALAVLFKVLDSTLSDAEKYATILRFDTVLGLGLDKAVLKNEQVQIPSQVQILLDERRLTREKKDFKKSDELRDKIKELGFIVKDSKDGQVVEKI